MKLARKQLKQEVRLVIIFTQKDILFTMNGEIFIKRKINSNILVNGIQIKTTQENGNEYWYLK